jgi:hypothetical protein
MSVRLCIAENMLLRAEDPEAVAEWQRLVREASGWLEEAKAKLAELRGND